MIIVNQMYKHPNFQIINIIRLIIIYSGYHKNKNIIYLHILLTVNLSRLLPNSLICGVDVVSNSINTLYLPRYFFKLKLRKIISAFKWRWTLHFEFLFVSYKINEFTFLWIYVISYKAFFFSKKSYYLDQNNTVTLSDSLTSLRSSSLLEEEAYVPQWTVMGCRRWLYDRIITQQIPLPWSYYQSL